MVEVRTYTDEFVEVRGLRIQLLHGGTGKPVLFVHGAGSGLWYPAFSILAADFHVYEPIHPGMGKSDSADWIEGVDDLVYHYLDFLDFLGLDRAPIIGASLGGWLAAEIAVAHPERVEKLVLVDAVGLRVPGAPIADIFARFPDKLAPLLYYDQALVEAAQAVEQTVETLQQVYRDRATVARLAWNPYFHNPKLPRRLYRVTMPTLIIWGAQDQIVPPAHGEEYHRLIPGSTFVQIERCGHVPHLEQPQEFARLVGDFLRS